MTLQRPHQNNFYSCPKQFQVKSYLMSIVCQQYLYVLCLQRMHLMEVAIALSVNMLLPSRRRYSLTILVLQCKAMQTMFARNALFGISRQLCTHNQGSLKRKANVIMLLKSVTNPLPYLQTPKMEFVAINPKEMAGKVGSCTPYTDRQYIPVPAKNMWDRAVE